MNIIDLSHHLANNMPIFPHDPIFCQKTLLEHEKDGFSLSIIKTGLHAGTHLDAPYHFDINGKKINEIPLEELIGPCQIVDINEQIIDICHLNNIQSKEILIFRTNWDKKWRSEEYFKNSPYLTSEAADFIVEKKIKGLGIDGPSVDIFGQTSIHKKILSNDIWIVENLRNLEKINTPHFEINFIPLNIQTEASLIRAFAKLY